MTPEEVPAPLKPWVGWVLDGEETLKCPHLYSDWQQRRCAWPTALVLKIDSGSGFFEQTWRVFAESRVTLPGEKSMWPQDVAVDGDPATVLVQNGRPAVMLDPGTHRLQGRFSWKGVPDAVAIPWDTGLVRVFIDGRPLEFPHIDENGRLWLKKEDPEADRRKKVEDRVDIQVFRLLTDDIPMEVVTAIDLQVSGGQRELLLEGALLKKFVPLDLKSPLPARLESGGGLRLQVRPGDWHVEVFSRSTSERTSLTLNETPSPWPANEIWAFDARNHLRLVEVKGVPVIDPRQTALPGGWRHLPAYRVETGDTMILQVMRRGDPDPAPDRLELGRHLWLDFEGSGYTVQDRITGTMTRGWRLEAVPEIQLGRVLMDGTPQFITTLPSSDRHGVEVRRGKLNLTADARYEKGISDLPATGWTQDFQQVRAVLHLPPGWNVLALRGVDNVPETWFNQWTLMDLFLVLMVALSFFKLWNWRWGILSLVMAVLIWHEPQAPRYVWLNILAAIALIRLLPAGRFRGLLTAYRNAALLVLILIAVPFMVNQVKSGLFPQLDRPWQSAVTGLDRKQTLAVSNTPSREPRSAMSDEMLAKQDVGIKRSGKSIGAAVQGSSALTQIDPNALVQTGPGIPDWRWRSIAFNWNGPVKQGQRIQIFLLSPGINLLLNVIRVILLVTIAVFLIRNSFVKKAKSPNSTVEKGAAVLIATALWLMPLSANAGFPNSALLTSLKEKLVSPSDCLPECAHVSRATLDIDENTLRIRLEIHAEGDVILPLPGEAGLWRGGSVLLNGADPTALYRSGNQELCVHLEGGVHEVLMASDLNRQQRVTLSFPITPGWTGYHAKGWTVSGISENGVTEGQVMLERITQGPEEQERPVFSRVSVIPEFARVERTLRLGLDWEVETVVTRLSPQPEAMVLDIPLVPGESVTTEGFSVKDGRVAVNMAPRQRSVMWRSVLEKQPEFTLTAPKTTRWIEVWKADVSAIWHTTFSGLSPIHHQDAAGRWLPEWRPWPGERITLQTIRPQGVKGRTLTVNGSHMVIRPGRRVTDVQLDISLNSSQGGQHTIGLPENAALQEVSIDGRTLPVRAKNRNVTLPVTPGTRSARLIFRSPSLITHFYTTPTVDLNAPSVNHRLNVRLGQDRWVLWLTGPDMGPAVLFWGVLLVVLIIAVGLGRVGLMPLKTWQWFLLGVGLSQTSVLLGVIVVGWLMALGMRKRMDPAVRNIRFNLIQFGLVLLTLSALGVLFFAVQKGLLGLPDMQISGNQSTAYQLNWFQDRVAGILPAAGIFSVPLTVYRIAMLLWALWLAFSLLSWLRWGWACFAANGIWRKVHMPRRRRGDATLDPEFDTEDIESEQEF